MELSTKSSGSDLEMMSQTEPEDTDTGEASSESTSHSSSSSETSSSSSALDSTGSDNPVDAPAGTQRITKPVNVSVDLTDVTELEDNELASETSSSNGEQNKQHSTKISAGGKTACGKKGMAGIDFSRDWFNHSCFRKYWQHYHEVMSWCRKHTSVYQNLTRTSSAKSSASFGPFPQRFQSPSMYPPTWNHPYMYKQHMNRNVDSQSNSSRKKHRRRRKQRQRKANSASSSEVNSSVSSETQTETSEEFQMEITQDMIDFFAKTQAHRKQRDEARKAEMEEDGSEAEHINVEDVKVTENRKPTVEAPKERPGAKRTAEMKLLYGKGAPMIHGMETALQMAYDRNIDLKQPKIWPNMPLRVVFS